MVKDKEIIEAETELIVQFSLIEVQLRERLILKERL